MHFLAGVAVAIACGLAPWAMARLQTRWLAIAAVPFLIVMIAGAVAGLAIYPYSDVFVAGFAILAGVALGRVMPPRFRPFLVLLLVLSVLDVAQNLAFGGPTPAHPPPPTAPSDPHLAWLNVRFPLPGGHFNSGFADLILIAGVSENLRRRKAGLALMLLPGVLGITLGEALLATLPASPPDFALAVAASLVVFLTAGYVLTELAVSQMGDSVRHENAGATEPRR